MKKILAMLASLLIFGGAVWGQSGAKSVCVMFNGKTLDMMDDEGEAPHFLDAFEPIFCEKLRVLGGLWSIDHLPALTQLLKSAGGLERLYLNEVTAKCLTTAMNFVPGTLRVCCSSHRSLM